MSCVMFTVLHSPGYFWDPEPEQMAPEQKQGSSLTSHPRLIPVIPAPQADIQALLDQGVGIASHAQGYHAGYAGQTSPSNLLFCKTETKAPVHCLPEDKEIVAIISASSPPMLNRNTETEFGRNRVVLFLLPEEEHGRLAPQELCPLPGDSKESYRWNS